MAQGCASRAELLEAPDFGYMIAEPVGAVGVDAFRDSRLIVERPLQQQLVTP